MADHWRQPDNAVVTSQRPRLRGRAWPTRPRSSKGVLQAGAHGFGRVGHGRRVEYAAAIGDFDRHWFSQAERIAPFQQVQPGITSG